MTDHDLEDTVIKIKTASLSGQHINAIEGKIIDPLPVINNSRLKQFIQDNIDKRKANKKNIEQEFMDEIQFRQQSLNHLHYGEYASAGNATVDSIADKATDFTFDIEHYPSDDSLRGGYRKNEIILLGTAFDTIKDIPMRISNLADDTVILVNNEPVDATKVHMVGLDDVVSARQTLFSDYNRVYSNPDNPIVDRNTRGIVGAAIARKRKKAKRKLTKRKY